MKLQEQMLRDGEHSDDVCDFLGSDPIMEEDDEEEYLLLNRNQ